ncbi:hypothetical protein [Pseudoalteromonas sp. JC3]|uniref:hypothetical protein n=1 Tax=Pseudoalteromonas sp. JC3 TaxID=2810196 RepID=UPI0019CFAB75|nr:hypothetical protein [Pseudoalteromonas sp. JC3]MBR8842487.1 hypothetical protein [Pseudoalteromonas sp. JC3]WJE09395.1 hypothetical protein QSH61_02685 [Pseudoalteromonas sp. JC3]
MIVRISLIISLAASLYLFSELFDASEERDNNIRAAAVYFVEPPVLSTEPILAEKEWYALLAAREAKNVKAAEPEEPKPKNQKTLTFDGVEFTLLGIFKNREGGFVLLKSSGSEVLKVAAGDAITENVALKAITVDSMTVLVSNKEHSIRLFKRVNEDSNG